MQTSVDSRQFANLRYPPTHNFAIKGHAMTVSLPDTDMIAKVTGFFSDAGVDSRRGW